MSVVHWRHKQREHQRRQLRPDRHARLAHNGSKDPTQTTVLRSNYGAAFYKRFRRLKGLIRTTIADNDALRLANRAALASPRDDFQFEDDPRKEQAFMEWFRGAIRDEVLEPLNDDALMSGQHYTGQYVRSAYSKGVEHAQQNLRAVGMDIAEEQVQAAFNRPIHKDTLRLLYRRNFRALEGVTSAVDKEVSRTLTDGFSQGWNPRKMASQLNDRVDKIGITRARTLARTETIRTHAEATLNEYERHGVQEVGAEVEFSAAMDERTCPICASLHGDTYSLKEARGVIPVHPNCRCSWIPVI